MPVTMGKPPEPSGDSKKRPAEMATPPPSKLRVPRASVIDSTDSLARLDVRARPGVFMVHTSRLRFSPYLNTMLDNIRANTHGVPVFTLRTMDPRPMKFYIHFLYTGTIASDIACAANDAIGRSTEAKLLCEFYEFGLVVKDSRFRNAVLDTIIDISYLEDKDGNTHIPDPNFFCTPGLLNTEARRCIVDLYVHTLDPDGPAIDAKVDQTFMQDVLKAALRKWDMQGEQASGRKIPLRKCDYHEHPDGVRCDDGDQK